jgi:ribosomal protein S18 acetylase RimI-like enzyme
VLALLDYDPGAMILAVDDDEVVGSVVLGWDGWRGHVYRLAVHPSYRRAGLGTTLLETAEQRARDHGCVRIDAIVFDEHARAQGLWATAGYRRQSRWSRWVKQL